MLKTAERFKAEILRRLDEVTEGQDEAIHEAAVIMADTIERGGIIRAFGSGHSHANALEICGRAGGYIQTKIVREPALGIYEMLTPRTAWCSSRIRVGTRCRWSLRFTRARPVSR